MCEQHLKDKSYIQAYEEALNFTRPKDKICFFTLEFWNETFKREQD